jgi:hypothetical protein
MNLRLRLAYQGVRSPKTAANEDLPDVAAKT